MPCHADGGGDDDDDVVRIPNMKTNRNRRIWTETNSRVFFFFISENFAFFAECDERARTLALAKLCIVKIVEYKHMEQSKYLGLCASRWSHIFPLSL